MGGNIIVFNYAFSSYTFFVLMPIRYCVTHYVCCVCVYSGIRQYRRINGFTQSPPTSRHNAKHSSQQLLKMTDSSPKSLTTQPARDSELLESMIKRLVVVVCIYLCSVPFILVKSTHALVCSYCLVCCTLKFMCTKVISNIL